MKKAYTYQDAHCPALPLSLRLKTVNPVCLDILYKRGIRTAEEMEQFLFPDLIRGLRSHPPMLDMDKAVNLLATAAKAKEMVVVYHDYDADGITAGAVAVSALRMLGVPVGHYCNDRATGGFGICAAGVDELREKYPEAQVLLTVDNGITGISGITHAKELGMKVIVTDHHEPDAELPPADAVIDHKRWDEPDTQDKNCCGAGVVWKLMLALYIQLGQNVDPVMELLDIVALGTVADVVPLLGDNRSIVNEGLRHINSGKRPFFRVLSEVMELSGIDSQTIAYKIAPMLNAVSRMGQDAGPVVELLLEENHDELKTGIIYLDEMNQARKEETAHELELALDTLPPDFHEAAIVIRNKEFQEGIVGIVAGQLKEAYCLPSIVLAKSKDGNWKGSCRSPEGFHLKQALDQCSEYLLSYGGHAKAAGVTVRSSDFAAFQEKFTALAAEGMAAGGFQEQTPIDMVLPASAYTSQLVRELSVLEPYGEGFPPPLFGVTANIVGTRFMGQENQHVKYADASGLSIIRWSGGEEARKRMRPPSKFVGTPQLNHWQGNISVQFIAD